MSERVTGTVKFFSGDKGYGFITPDTPGENGKVVHDIFVHRSDLDGNTNRDEDDRPVLLADQRVSFDIVKSDRKKGDGMKAAQVSLLTERKEP